MSYEEQLKMLASEQRVDLLDAIRHAGVNERIYYRSFKGKTQLRYDKAELIASAIRDLAAR